MIHLRVQLATHTPFILVFVVSIWMIAIQIGRADTLSSYSVPTLAIPYATHKPTMEGVIRDDEWQNAASVSALQTTSKLISARQSRFWMMWDEDDLYVAMRSPLRPGERVIQAFRDPDHDVNSVFDDAYEIWLDLGTHSPDGEPVYFQYLANFAGTRYDVMFEPAVGNSRIGWTSHWQTHNRITPDGRNWEMEITIPRTSMYKSTPFSDGFVFSGLLARDYKRPWDQVSFGGAGSFSVRETYPKFVLSRTAPAIHLLSVGDPETQKFGFDIAMGGRGQPVRWEISSDGSEPLHGRTTLGPISTRIPEIASATVSQHGDYRITVQSDDTKKTYLDWGGPQAWGDRSALSQVFHDTEDRVVLTQQYNPVHHFLRVKGDLIDFDKRGEISRYRLEVRDSHSALIAVKSLHLDKLNYVRDVLHLPVLVPGNYKASLTAFDRTGKVVFVRGSDFVQKDPATSFAWWNTKRGNIERVIAPWTPVRTSAGRFDVWGRSMSIGNFGLPSQVVSQGRPLLAGPSQLQATFDNSAAQSAEGAMSKIVSAAPNRGIVHSTGRLGPLQIDTNITAEFDGMYRVDMTYSAAHPTTVRSLKIVVPIRSSVAAYMHACGEGIRYGFDYGFLPAGKHGKLWNSESVDGQPMAVGSFLPYVWLGDTNAGLCWFADSDAGWVPNNSKPAIEIRRDHPGSTDLVLNLISTPCTVSAHHTVSFAFQATPVKPLQANWRMDTWWTNDSFQDWAQIESQGHAGAMGLIFSSLPFPLNPAVSKQMVSERHKQTNESIFGVSRYRANAVPYFEHINMGEQFVPELGYFGDEWRTQGTRGLSYGKSLQDFMVYHVSHWVNDSDIDGFYIDNVAPLSDSNVEAGRGYVLPSGAVQPAYQMFETRRYLLRLRAALAEQGKSGKLVLHVTNHMIAPWLGACDIALDGEDHVIYPAMHKDFMDFWSPGRLRLDVPGQWGTAVNFLQEYQGKWDQPSLKKAMRAYSGMLILNDTLASANANGLNQELWRARDAFGFAGNDVHFIPYWQPNNGLVSQTKLVYVSGWRKQSAANGELLLAVVNTGEGTDAHVRIETKLLRMGTANLYMARDAETGTPIELQSDGSFSVAIPRHDYSQIVISRVPQTAAP